MNKTLLFALAGVLLLGATTYLVASQKGNNLRDSSLEQEWKAFKKTYGKKYADPAVDNYRMEVFAMNLQVVAEDTTGTYGVTQFFDLTPIEFQSTYLTLEAPATAQAVDDLSVNATSINWATAGYVTAVKNQASCGSCWAFSTTGALESALIINGAATQSVDLSEQQLVDCSTTNSGCKGGLMDRAFKYIKNNKIVTNAAYPYTATKSSCDKADITGTKYTLSGYTDVS